MKIAPKHIAVAVTTREPARIAEALRAAVGLGLRGDEVTVAFAGSAAPSDASSEPAAAKALATLRALGRRIEGPEGLAEILTRADAVEVWT